MLTSVRIDAEAQTLSGIPQKVPLNYRTYLDDKKGKYRYKSSESAVLDELHMYTTVSPPPFGQLATFNMSDIAKIEVLERDKVRSTVNTLLVVAGVTVGVFAVAGAVYAATKSSCPFVSAYDGENFVLQGETFGGSFYPSLAREDCLPLPALAAAPELKLCISNELQERQYTDMALLRAIRHPAGSRIVCSPTGQLLAVSGETAVQSAWLNQTGKLVTNLVRATDNLPCSFNDTLQSVNRLYLNFDATTTGSGNRCLLLQLRSSYWSDYLYGQFASHFGSNYDSWRNQQAQRPASELIAWRSEQQIPLTISVKTAQGWRQVAQLPPIGPLMSREVAIPIDVPDLPANAEVMLSTGFLFWEVDKASLATVLPVSAESITYLNPALAVDENGKDVLPALLHQDGIYLEQPAVGNRAYLTYTFGAYDANAAYSFFLQTRGYYEPVRSYAGNMDTAFLLPFRTPGQFARYSLSHYKERSQQVANLANH
jgi:hypothetical protein